MLSYRLRPRCDVCARGKWEPYPQGNPHTFARFGRLPTSPSFHQAMSNADVGMPEPKEPADVLRFWFGDPPHAPRTVWFRRDADFDALIRARYGALTERALQGALNARWQHDAAARLAQVIVLDQFTRNLGRGTAAAFAGDAQALALARRMQAEGDDLKLPLLHRWFAYMPFEHAEDLAAQQLSVALFAKLADEARHSEPQWADAMSGAHDYAQRHLEVIERYGRFPHRNAALGRPNTKAEQDYLAQPGAGF